MSTSAKQTDLFQYILIIRKERTVNINVISILLCLISFVFFVYYSLLQNSFINVLFIGSLLIPVTVVRVFFINNKKKDKQFNFKHPLFISGILWLFIPGLRWIFILFVLFVLFDHQARQPLEIGISDEQIVINTFFRKKYQWAELSNVVLKDSLLTLDFKNNRILQREIEPLRSNVDEKEFNTFCAAQLQNV